MEFDNDRDRFSHGYDAGVIVNGVVTEIDGRLVLVDEDGVGFDPNIVLSDLKGKTVRMTIVSFETIDVMEEMIRQSHTQRTE